MTNFTNDDLYQMVLNRLRKDRKGSITPEEFESLLKYRSYDYFNQQFKVAGANQINHESLDVFTVLADMQLIVGGTLSDTYCCTLVPMPDGMTTTTDAGHFLDYSMFHLINAWYSTSLTSLASLVEIDILSNAEIHDRLNNAITAPSETHPCGYLEDGCLWLYGVTTGYVAVDYYRHPYDPYFDYYTDASGNITYLLQDQASYTLKAGEVARDGSTAGAAVTSVSEDLEWDDHDAVNILDMVMTDLGVAMTSQDVTQASILERQNNVKS